jgi:hypothetical protein
MYFLSFLNDLGIIPNKNTQFENNPSLLQGQEYMDYTRMYNRKITPRLKNLQITPLSDKGVHSIIEEMDNQRNEHNVSPQQSISDLENNFNKVLDKYNSTYKLLIEQLIRNQKTDKNIQQYFGKVVTTNDGIYHYVNNYGYTHKYSDDAWKQNNESCTITPDTVTNDIFTKFKMGHDMGVGQPCKIAGSNIQNKKTKEHAWVDVKGFKHIYSASLWNNKTDSCNIPVISLEDETYNAIPSAGNMRDTTECIQLDIDPGLWSNLAKLNKELVGLAKKINDEISNLSVKDVTLKNKISQEQKKIDAYISSLNDDYKNIKQQSGNMLNVYGSKIDSNLQRNADKMSYVVWFIILLTILLLTGHAYTTENRFYDIIGVVLAIIMLYIISRFIYNLIV